MCLEVVNNFAGAADPAVSNAFFQQYFLSIIQDIFFVLTDADHKGGFKMQSVLLARMFQLVELNMIQTPLFDPSQSNSVALREYSATLLKGAFPHVQPYAPSLSHLVLILTSVPKYRLHVQAFVSALSENHNDINRFKLALRDFLVQLKEFSVGDNAELFLEEKETETLRKAEEERQAAMKIPGMLKPSQIEDQDEDLALAF